jgi:hypothetical protein
MCLCAPIHPSSRLNNSQWQLLVVLLVLVVPLVLVLVLLLPLRRVRHRCCRSCGSPAGIRLLCACVCRHTGHVLIVQKRQADSLCWPVCVLCIDGGPA